MRGRVIDAWKKAADDLGRSDQVNSWSFVLA
jgi:hypothetical protein